MGEAINRQGGEFHLTKETSEYTGEAGSFCTVTSSNLDAIKVGSKIIYTAPASEPVIESDLVIVSGDDTLTGHVLLDVPSASGTLAILGGTGAFAGFRADTVVTFDGTEWHWDGTYTVAPVPAVASS
jgi:hypothetical protein